MPPKKRQIEYESEKERPQVKKSKGANSKAAAKGQPLGKGSDAEGNTYWEIAKNRRIGSSTFKGNTLINIREYYTDANGEAKPGKKGISLSLEQYNNLLSIIPELNASLLSNGLAIVSQETTSAAPAAAAPAKKPTAKSAKKKKANIEETSDEEVDEEED
ncbi:transcriptional Coactivator p15-domain-containing protein [Lasiosphaeria miniovina]|uniref:Transcriptional Coactivator p15-domain-containing protein n=1 Tax=Lasiosphaeria miniovina TaxID=1954250 RepID=A0AA40B7A7_9PEZI|nr:transcriptional Coactivator p15-domain-containing protein [Lasiosphaeria miniovina]KAK0728663.1 transcriptional Coactivator p15-domain-containing protein [Lasiosphaeria miniovina]